MNAMSEAHLDPAILSSIIEANAPWDEFLNVGVDEDFDDLEDIEDVEELSF